MPVTEDTEYTTAEQAFASDVAASVQSLRDAIISSVATLPNLVGRSATELSRQLSIGGKLAWKVHWLLTHPDPVTASAYVPGRAGLNSLTKGLRDAGTGEREVVAVERAATEFLKCVERKADDRLSFDSLVASVASEDKHALECRKMAHQGARFVWGVEAELYTVTEIVRPTEGAADRLDVALVRGVVGCQRLRSNVPIRVGVAFKHVKTEQDDATRVHASIDKLAGRPPCDGELPIMQSYCSGPLPAFTECPGTAGVKEYKLGPGPIGREGRFDLVTGEYIRGGLVQEQPESGDEAKMGIRLRLPARMTVFDAVVHRDVFHRQPSGASLHTDLYDRPFGKFEPEDELDVPKLEMLRATSRDLRLSEAPKLADAVIETLTTLDWDPREFNVYRLRMAYAPIPTSMWVKFSAD